MIYQTYHTLWKKIRRNSILARIPHGDPNIHLWKLRRLSRHFLPTFHVKLIAKAPTFFKFFLIMFEFIYLFVIIQKNSNVDWSRAITVYYTNSFYEGISTEPTKTYLGCRREWTTRRNFNFQTEDRSADISKKSLSKVSLRLFIKTLLAIMNFLLWASSFSKNLHNDYRPLKILSLLDGDFPQSLFITDI